MKTLLITHAKRLRFLIHPLFLILTGTLLTILSALISRNYISANDEAVRALRGEIAQKEELISYTWQTVQGLERKKDTIVLLGAYSRDGALKEMPKMVRAILLSTEISQEELLAKGEPSIDELLKAIDREKLTLIDKINDVYLEKSTKESQIAAIQQRTGFWDDLALLLQLLGLIFVLSKDIDRYARWR